VDRRGVIDGDDAQLELLFGQDRYPLRGKVGQRFAVQGLGKVPGAQLCRSGRGVTLGRWRWGDR
ncbi:MAG: hypothetical protein M3355_07500, partial [Actinomycetota bacterium]|nr:hypothetical protein [Actinomycetota bacterium]